jgi:hypothetical protein
VEAHAFETERALAVVRRHEDSAALLLLVFRPGASSIRPPVGGRWRKALDSGEDRWAGSGRPGPPWLERGAEGGTIDLPGPRALLYLAER